MNEIRWGIVVYIATPPSTHCEYALRVAAAGKHCYVEKPMSRNNAFWKRPETWRGRQ